MIEEKSIEEFRNTGLLLIINQILHIFGWAIVIEFNDDNEPIRMYPARCKFRGFSDKSVEKSYKLINDYLKNNINEISKDLEE